MEPLCLIGKGRTTFAKVAACSGCSRLIGDPRPVYGCPIRPMEAKSWGTSLALMLEHRRERIGAPLYFVPGPDGVLVPEGMKVPVQADLPDDEVPF